MLGRRGLAVSVVLVALMAMFVVVSINDNSAEGVGVGEVGMTFDLAAALDNATSGDVITLSEDTMLSGNATVLPGVTLDDGGFSLEVRATVTLSVEGTFISTGSLVVDYGASVTVASGGLMSTDGNTANIAGTLEVQTGGTANIGCKTSSDLEMQGAGQLLVGGTLFLGDDTGSNVYSTINVKTATVTGTLEIRDGSTFAIYDILTVGSAPTLVTDPNNATITGKVFIGSTAGILVYGKSSFSQANILFSTASTEFTIAGNTYAKEYKDLTGKKALIIPSTSGLKDWNVVNWTIGDITVTNDSNIQIGDLGGIVSGNATRITYMVVFAEDKSVIWTVNLIDRGSSYQDLGPYDTTYSVSVRSAPGNTGQPTIYVNGEPLKGVAPFSVTIKEDTTFTTSNHYTAPSPSKEPIILAILGIVIIIFILVLAVYLMRNKKKGSA